MTLKPHTAEMLTQQDVNALMVDRTPERRAKIASKVAVVYRDGDLSDSARALGEDIFRKILHDAEIRVRSALSDELKTCPNLPKDVALGLARDVEQVAIPMLETSSVLSDRDLADLVTIVGKGGRQAIARRTAVSENLAQQLFASGEDDVAETLVANEGAELSENLLQSTVDRHGQSKKFQDALVHRSHLPVVIAERLVAMVSSQMRDYLVTRHDLPIDLVTEIIMDSRERATVSLLPPGANANVDLEELITQLKINKRLRPSLILRALCLGDLAFFEAAIAVLAAIPLINARMLVHDPGLLGFKAVYNRAGLPYNLYPAFRVALGVVVETEYDGGAHDRERLCRRVIERVLTQYESLDPADLEFLMHKLDHFTRMVA